MKVLWFNHRDPHHPSAGGAEVRIHEIGKRLIRHGHEVTLICEQWPGSKKVEFIDGIRVLRIGSKYDIHLKVPFLLKQFNNDFDVVVDDIAHAVPWFSPAFTDKPVIGQFHHVHQGVLFYELPPFLAGPAYLMERTARFLYDELIAVSESTKMDLVEKFGVPPDRIFIVPNGVNFDLYKPCEKSKIPTILWVGRVKRYKRVEHLLLAFKIVKREIQNTKLLIIGDGDYLKYVKLYARRLGLFDVVFTGWISEKEKIRLMGSSWVIVNPSIVEGWSLSVIEAAACGTPCIAYDVAGLRDSVRNGETGLLVENGNIRGLAEAIIRILRDEDLRRTLSKNALEYSRNFDWDRTANEFMNVIKETI